MREFTSIERWMPINGYEWIYLISDSGKVWSNNIGREMVQSKMKTGYMSVELRRYGLGKRVLVHRLVASAFLSNDASAPEVNHRDGDKANNKLSNLEWVTKSENSKHAFNNGLRKVYSPWSGKKLSEDHKKKVVAALRKCGFAPRKIVVDTVTGQKYPSAKAAAKEIKMGYGNLKGMLNGNFKNKTTLIYEGVH